MPDVSPITGAKVALWCDPLVVAADRRLAQVILPDGVTILALCQATSERLWKRTGKRWMGLQSATIRPHHLSEDCGSGMPPTWGEMPGDGWWGRFYPEGLGCGCSVSELSLPGGNVVSVDEVRVDGVVLDPSEYQLYDNRRLVRVADPTSGTRLTFPCCQLLSVPLTEPGTWSYTYTFGQLPPMDGQLAAYAWTVERALRFDVSKGVTPPQAKSVTGQGFNITLSDPKLADGKTGIPEVDEFLDGYPRTPRARIYSPDTIEPAVVSRTQT